MQGWRELARATTASGDELRLRERAGSFEIRCNGWELMSSRAHASEARMAAMACDGLAMACDGLAMACDGLATAAPRVLIGGLGMGYTLRAALDCLPAAAEVIVAELLPEIIAWNRGVLAPLAGHPLDDSRVHVVCGDVADLLRDDGFDVIVLDVDNGPDAIMVRENALLYSTESLLRLRRALRRDGGREHVVSAGTAGPKQSRSGGLTVRRSDRDCFGVPGLAMSEPARGDVAPGVLAVWSADPSPAFEHRLADAGFRWTRTDIPARGAPDDPLHSIYLAHA